MALTQGGRHCFAGRRGIVDSARLRGYAEGTGAAMQIAGYGVPIRSVLAPRVALF